jgi:hypothetical protein
MNGRVLNKLRVLVQENRWITVTEIADKLEMTSVVDQHILSSMRTSGITKFAQGGCQSSSQMSSNEHAWKHAYNFCRDIVIRERLSCNGLSQVVKCGHHYEPASKCKSME